MIRSSQGNVQVQVQDLREDVVIKQMDRFRLYEEIRKIDNKVKVCFIRVYEVSYQAMRPVFPAATTTDGCFIWKPVDIDDLIKHIEAELMLTISCTL